MSEENQQLSLQEQFAQMQQQIQQQQITIQLMQQQQQQQPLQQDTQPQPSFTYDYMEPSEDLSHSIPIRPRFDWTPSANLVHLMHLDQDLFVEAPLLDRERKKLIESYPPIDGLDYQPPEAVPAAFSMMNEHQRSQDGSLKSAQYLLSAIFRPLDILSHEIYSEDAPNAKKYLKMIYDTRLLLLHANSTINQYRTNLGYKAINRDFRLTSGTNEQRYTVPTDEFHARLHQLHSTNKSIQEAKQFGRKKKQPFRSGPPSQHGGSNFDRTFGNFKPNQQSQGQGQHPQHQQQSFQQRKNAHPNSNNPFRQSNNNSNRK